MGRVKETTFQRAKRWADNPCLIPHPEAYTLNRLNPEEWITDDYKESACIAQQLYAERMGWTK